MAGKRILVVEASENIRRSLETLLTGHGFVVATASSFGEAARAAEARRPGAVVVASRALGGGHSLGDSPALAGVPIIEADRVHEIMREMHDGWQRRGAASRDLITRLERRIRAPWTEALIDAPFDESEAADLSGDLANFPLTDVLESITGCGLTGRLIVSGESISGAIFVDAGAFVHARLDEPYPCDEYLESLDLMLTLGSGRFALHVEELPAELDEHPRLPLMSVLIERLRIEDEGGTTELRPIGLPA